MTRVRPRGEFRGADLPGSRRYLPHCPSRGGKTGGPLGNADFIEGLERIPGCPIARHAPEANPNSRRRNNPGCSEQQGNVVAATGFPGFRGSDSDSVTGFLLQSDAPPPPMLQ